MLLYSALVLFLSLWGLPQTDAFYLPGVAPHSYEEGETVMLKVNKLSSVKTLLPYDYYSLKFCKPPGGIKSYSENLGEFLRGDRIENSAYEITMLKEEYCRVVCQVNLNTKEKDAFRDAVQNKYHHNWIMDNLPAASILDDDQYVTTEYVGYPVGFEELYNQYIYNHVNIIIEYHTIEPGAHRIVGFYVEPLSINHKFNSDWNGKLPAPPSSSCSSTKHLAFEDIKKSDRQKVGVGKLTFSYGVEWRSSSVKWASRWDVYLSMNHAVPERVHWLSIANSILVVVFLSFMVAMILVRTINKDIHRYNRLPTDEERAEEREESGWKLVHGDVFRPPTDYPMLLCISAGTGLQLIICCFFFILFAAVGFLSPANRGSIMIGMLMLFVIMGAVAGFVSARMYKTFKGEQWQKNTILTATFYPGIVFSIFFVLDLVVWSYGSTGAVPIVPMLVVIFLWFGISVPLVFLGAYFGYRMDPIEFPVVTSNIPRQIPEQPWHMQPIFTTLLGGILPFGACFVELFFIMSSVWMDQYYYVFGFLLIVYIILAITCAEIATVLNYFQLCNEDYRWWWRSMLTSGSTAVYIFLYSIIYFARLESTMTVTYTLYFAYNFVICLLLFLITGTFGLFSSWSFNQTIYGSIKVD